MPPTSARPRTFAGDPNPPPKAPTPAPAASGSAAPMTSAGTGSLPPEAQPKEQVPAEAPETFRVVDQGNGAREIYRTDSEGDTKWGTVNIAAEDADKVLHALGQHDETSGIWDNVPREAVDKLRAGRLPLPEYLEVKWGEGTSLRGLIGLNWLNGKFSDDEAKARGNTELLKGQLKEAPLLAWQGGFGATVAKMWDDLSSAGVAGTARRAAGEVATATPDLLNMTGDAAKSAGALGLVGAGVGMAVGGPAGALAGLEAGGQVGAAYGVFKHVFDVTSGNTAVDMLDKGFDPATIRTLAPLAGALNGALMEAKVNVMTAAMQKSVIGKMLESKTATGVLARYIADTSKGVALSAAQKAVDIALTDVAAQMDNRPDLAIPHPITDIVNAAITSAPVMAAMGMLNPAIEAVRLKTEAQTEGGASGEGGVDPVLAAGVTDKEPAKKIDGGYSLKFEKDKVNDSYEIVARNAKGEKVGTLGVTGEKDGNLLGDVIVENADRRKGVATAMYDFAEERIGKKFVPSSVLTENGEAFWANRNPEKVASNRLNATLRDFDEGRATAEDVAAARGAVEEARYDAMIAAEKPAGENKYVVDRPLDIKAQGTDKETAAAIRDELIGKRNEQIVRGNQFADEIRRAVPDAAERQGMFWYKAAEGDKAILQDALRDPELAKYHEQIQAALDLSPKAIETLGKINQYYEEAGQVASDIGTVKSLRENYQNRIYAPEKPTDFVKTETAGGLKRSTAHAKMRTFDTEFEAARAGKTFATTDVADTLSVHNEEMARVNYARKTLDTMAEMGLGAWKREVPDGWARVGTLEKTAPIRGQDGKAVIGADGNQVVSHSVFVAPQGIADGLQAVTDPNFIKKIDSLRNIQRYQGLVKTLNLSLIPGFHHFSLLMQSIYQRDFSTLMQLPNIEARLSDEGFLAAEQHFALHGGITTTVDANWDVLRNLTEQKGDLFSKITNAPGIKQALELGDKNAEFLFGKMQRLMKVNDYMTRSANWVAANPEATNAEVTTAMRGLARHVNSVYGGLNWEAMGMTKSNLSILRLGMLAPDWTTSNLSLLKQAIGEGGAAGNASRAHILSSLAIGMVGTELLNKILTGHFTDENKTGHKLEIQFGEDVYVSLLRGGIGDIAKFASMVTESGLGGATQFAQGKLSPFARTAAGLAANKQYSGAKAYRTNAGPVAGTYDVLKFILANAGPVPLGISNLVQYAQSGGPTAAGGALVGSGVGRFSKPRRSE